MKDNKLTILVSSFDGFADCWKPFIHGFKKYWPDCDYDIFLITNYLDSPDEDLVPSIKVGEDLGWASNIKKALKKINSDYVLYLQEDYWLNQEVNTKNLQVYLNRSIINNWEYFRISPLTVPKEFSDDLFFNTTGKYRLALQSVLWKKDFLQSLLFDGESGWDFESKSEERLAGRDVHTYSINSDLKNNFIMSYCWGTAVRKGKWTEGAIDFVKNEKIDFDLSKRMSESKLETWLIKLSGRSFIFKIIAFFIIRFTQFLKGERSISSTFST